MVLQDVDETWTGEGSMFTHPWEGLEASPADIIPLKLPENFHDSLLVAWDNEPISYRDKKEISSIDSTWKTRQGEPQAYYRPDITEPYFVLYPQPSSPVYEDIYLDTLLENSICCSYSWESSYYPELIGNKISNGHFSVNTTGWNAAGGTIDVDSSGYKNQCLKIINVSNPTPNAWQALSGLAVDNIYELNIWVKSGTSGDLEFKIAVFNSSYANKIVMLGTSSGSWTKHTATFQCDDTSGFIYLYQLSSAAGTMLFDEVSLKLYPLSQFTIEDSDYEINPAFDWEYKFNRGINKVSDSDAIKALWSWECAESHLGTTVAETVLSNGRYYKSGYGPISYMTNIFAYDDSISDEAIDSTGNVLFIYRTEPKPIDDDSQESDYPGFLRKYIEYATLERAYSVDNDGQIDSLRDYWGQRKNLGIEIIKRYASKRKVDRDYRLLTKGIPGGRRYTRHARLPDEYPPI
jgi:hypothetical protein